MSLSWNSLHNISAILESLKSQGAKIDSLGTSPSGRSIPVIRIQGRSHQPNLLMVAGLHATELTGVLAALDFATRWAGWPDIPFSLTIAPMIDIDGIHENIHALPRPFQPHDCFGAKLQKDLEGQFLGSEDVGCLSLRNLMDSLPSVDFYFSLHCANHAVPGAFFYVDGPEDLIKIKALRISHQLRAKYPLLEADPTQTANENLAPGFFLVPSAKLMETKDGKPRSTTTYEYVRRRHPHCLVAVTEIPTIFDSINKDISLEGINYHTRNFLSGAYPYDAQLPLTCFADFLSAFLSL